MPAKLTLQLSGKAHVVFAIIRRMATTEATKGSAVQRSVAPGATGGRP